MIEGKQDSHLWTSSGPFIHHFPPRKQILLKMLSKITQALEKINLFSP